MNNDQESEEKFTINVKGADFIVKWDETSLTENTTRYHVEGNNLEFDIELEASEGSLLKWIVAKGENIPDDLAEAVGQKIEDHDM